ncbi:MAG: lysophospholipid acyltransferase family protein, partial [Pseudomonadota bacterium]
MSARDGSAGALARTQAEQPPFADLTATPLINPIRGALVLTAFIAMTVPLMPVQALLKRVAPDAARRFPHWYHRRVCGLLGLRVHVRGAQPDPSRPTLYVANHVSWMDIPILSAVAPVAFVAKKEVDSWPGIAWLARLQRTVFVDRERRSRIGQTAGEITERLQGGCSIVLFAEGTSSDGNRVLPFRSSLFAAALPPKPVAGEQPPASTPVSQPVMRTAAITYTRLH